MKDIKDLKKAYQELSRREKEIVGAALVKVNLGVALPTDLKMVAGFIKGSPYIAKEGNLELLIQALNADDEVTEGKNLQMISLIAEPTAMSDESVKNLTSFEEDSEVTQQTKK